MKDDSLLPSHIKLALSDIAQNNTESATQLFLATLKLFPEIAGFLEQNGKDPLPLLNELSTTLHQIQPEMAPFVHLDRYVRRIVEGEFKIAVVVAAFRAMPLAANRQLEKAKRQIVAHAIESCRGYRRLMVHSRSHLVESFLRAWLSDDQDREVWVTESRPMREGEHLINALKDLPNKKVLLVDDARSLALEEVEAVLIGTDLVTETRVRNKIGSRALLAVARQLKKPSYVLADFMKFLPDSVSVQRPERAHPGEEIAVLEQDVSYFNYYFETCELKCVDHFVTPRGVLSPAEIRHLFDAELWDVFRFPDAAERSS